MKETFMMTVVALIPITLFSLAAFLISRNVSGWGWFLFCVFLITGSMRYSYTPDNLASDENQTVKGCDP